MKIPTMKRTRRALRPPFPAIRWIVAAALVTLTSVACDVHSPVGPGAIASLTLTPNQTTMAIHGTQQLTARAFDADGREIIISGPGATSSALWEMVNGGGTVDDAGFFRAGTELGTYTNTVRVSHGGREAFASFTIIAGPAAAIVVTPNPDTLGIGVTRQFTATAVDAGGNPVPVTPTWAIVNGGGQINSGSGAFTAGTTAGTFTNTVQASSGSLSGFATVTVVPGPAATLTVSPNPHFMPINGTQQFTATAVDASGNVVPVTATWSVVSGGGTINASTGVFTGGTSLGTFNNTVRATSGSLSGSATVTVMAGPAVAIAVTPNPATIGTNGTQQFTATAVDAAGNPASISPAWSVENGGGTINASSGMFTAGTTTGSFTNTVRATSGGVSGSATVNVTGGSAAVITVTPNPATVGSNGTQQFTAAAVDANGNSVSITPVWSVEDGGGTINASTGVFTAGATTGTFTNTVRATSGGVFGSATVTVTSGSAAVITVSPDPATVEVGNTQQFTATAEDGSGNPISITPVWSVENGGGEIDSATGVFTAGTTTGTFNHTVTATSGSISGTATVEVNASPPAPANFRLLTLNDLSCTEGAITGDVGFAASSGSFTDSSCDLTGDLHEATSEALAAYDEFSDLYAALQPVACDEVLTGTLAGQSLDPGVYCFDSAATLTGLLTLNGGETDTWLFKIGTTGTGALTGSSFDVVMAGGAQACNVTWWVRDGVAMTDSTLKGIVLAGPSASDVTFTRGAFDGNAWSQRDLTVTETTVTDCTP